VVLADSQSMVLVQADTPHVRSQLCAALQAIAPEQEPSASQSRVQAAPLHVTFSVHEFAAVHSTRQVEAVQVVGPEQDPGPEQFTVHVDPPQVTPPVHELAPHSTSQLAACEQSTAPVQPPSPHCTTQSTPGGHATSEEHAPEQSMTHRPFASQVPPGHDCDVHAAAPGDPPPPDDEPQAARRARTRASGEGERRRGIGGA
jgi:hypothetical protein